MFYSFQLPAASFQLDGSGIVHRQRRASIRSCWELEAGSWQL